MKIKPALAESDLLIFAEILKKQIGTAGNSTGYPAAVSAQKDEETSSTASKQCLYLSPALNLAGTWLNLTVCLSLVLAAW